jgi:L-threonylcarbamoyladenylate synthase
MTEGAPPEGRRGEIIAPDEAGIARAAAALRAGELVGMPTETVYGLAANALDADAVARVFEAKRRPSFDPLIVHVPDVMSLDAVVRDPLSGAGEALARAFWPGPLTLVVQRSGAVPDLVTSGLETVAVRVPSHSVAQRLLRAAGVPLAAPSANPFGAVSPTRAEHVRAQLGDAVAVILDGGPCEVGLESTIVSLVGEQPVVLRFGGVPVEAIEAVVGPVEQRLHSSDRPEAPGQLSRHYATRTPLHMVTAATMRPSADAALLVVSGPPPTDALPARDGGYGRVVALSDTGDVRVAARGLFAALRELDGASFARIDVIPCGEEGLGRAILDRLRRAAVAPHRAP